MAPEDQENKLKTDVQVWMSRLRDETAVPETLPAAGLILFKSKLMLKQSTARVALRPILWAQLAAGLVLLVGFGGILTETGASTFFGLTLQALNASLPLLISGVTVAAASGGLFAFIFKDEGKTTEDSRTRRQTGD